MTAQFTGVAVTSEKVSGHPAKIAVMRRMYLKGVRNLPQGRQAPECEMPSASAKRHPLTQDTA